MREELRELRALVVGPAAAAAAAAAALTATTTSKTTAPPRRPPPPLEEAFEEALEVETFSGEKPQNIFALAIEVLLLRPPEGWTWRQVLRLVRVQLLAALAGVLDTLITLYY